MRTIQSLLLAALACWLGGNALAQSYSINGFKIAGGGGASANGPYSLSGTIGQHDAGGPMTNGPYSLEGGFWTLYAVQMPGAPLLSITFNPQLAKFTVSWPSSSTNFTLQQSTNLNTTHWVSPPETVSDDGTNKFILVTRPPAGGRTYRFYRLYKP